MANDALTTAQRKAVDYRHEFITPGHLLSAFLDQYAFMHTLEDHNCNVPKFSTIVEDYLKEEIERISYETEYELETSVQLDELLQHGYSIIDSSGVNRNWNEPFRCPFHRFYDRFLPDKAIDLVDEAGTYREIHPTTAEVQYEEYMEHIRS